MLTAANYRFIYPDHPRSRLFDRILGGFHEMAGSPKSSKSFYTMFRLVVLKPMALEIPHD